MRRQGRTATHGFSLIEAAVAIGIIAILAAAAAPLVLKALNQQREQKTRDNLKAAWEAMFGARDRRVANMRSDYGFNPAGALTNLGQMVNPFSPPAPNPPTYGLNGLSFYWGWNGPYWSGSTRPIGAVAAPVDAWGNPIQLRLVTGAFPGFQLISGGSNGRIDSANNNRQPLVDDIVYPEFPTTLGTAYSATVYVSLTNNRLATAVGTAPIWYRLGGVRTQVTPVPAFNIAPGNPQPVGPYIIPAGPTSFSVTINASAANPPIPAYAAQSFSQIVDLLPGETRTISFTAN
jgi:prepilin-type N-terminal cleavage/methylation domain-containing protein